MLGRVAPCLGTTTSVNGVWVCPCFRAYSTVYDYSVLNAITEPRVTLPCPATCLHASATFLLHNSMRVRGQHCLKYRICPIAAVKHGPASRGGLQPRSLYPHSHWMLLAEIAWYVMSTTSLRGGYHRPKRRRPQARNRTRYRLMGNERSSSLDVVVNLTRYITMESRYAAVITVSRGDAPT